MGWVQCVEADLSWGVTGSTEETPGRVRKRRGWEARSGRGASATEEGRRRGEATKKCSSGLLAMGSVMFGARGRSSEDAIDGVWGAGTKVEW